MPSRQPAKRLRQRQLLQWPWALRPSPVWYLPRQHQLMRSMQTMLALPSDLRGARSVLLCLKIM